MVQVKGVFAKILHKNAEISSKDISIDESIVDKPLSLELFKEELAHLGYNFKVYTNSEGKIYRFERISPSDANENGDVW